MLVGATIDSRRARLSLVSVLALLAGLLAAMGGTPANAVQAPGNDAPAWTNGWSWNYDTTFRYVGDGTDVTLNESVTYTVAQTNAVFQGEDAYRLNITGNITGGGGSTQVPDFGNVNLTINGGSVSGTRYVRKSDMALLQEQQHQEVDATANVLFGVAVDAVVDLTLTPEPGWRTHVFPLNPGDNWDNDVDVAYTGGFSYTSSVASGESPFDGSFAFDGPSTVAAGSIAVPAGNLAADVISAQSDDGQTVDNHWWSDARHNDARQFTRLPLDGAVLTIDRKLRSSNTPTPGTTITETITDSLTCAGDTVTVAGKLSSNASGVPITVTLDKSAIAPGLKVTTTTNTTAGGNYSTTITAPSENDGQSKNGSRANWGVLVSGGGASNVATLVVNRKNCTALDYTGVTSVQQGGTATVSAKLTDLAGGSVSGRTISFAVVGGGSATATTNASGVASTTMTVAGPPRDVTITATFAESATQTGATDSVPFSVGTVATTTTVLPSESPATVNESLTFSASVTPALPGDPGGSVQFAIDGADFGAPVAVVGGSATSAAYTPTVTGTQTVTATYLGDDNFAGSASPAVPFLVRQPLQTTTTTSAVAPTSSVFGQSITLSAAVAKSGSGATPTGTVVFSEGGTVLGAATVDGSGAASTTISDLPVGSHSIVATYSGDDTYRGSAASAKTATVTKAAVSVEIASSDTSTVSGETVNFTAGVSVQAPGAGTAVGNVQLVVDGSPLGAPVQLDGGSAVFPPVTSLLAGSHTVAAVYSGSPNFLGGSDSLTQDVAQADTNTIVTASPSPSAEGQNVDFTANVSPVAPGSGSPTGTIVFTADGDLIGAAALEAGPGGSEATVTLADLAPGSYNILAAYAGDTGYAASDSAPISHTVTPGVAIVPTTTVATSSENPSTFGELISFRAEVAADDNSTPTGLVQFSIDGIDVGAPVALDGQGVAESVTLASPDPGDHTVIAAYVPDVGFGSSGDFITQTVEAAGVDLGVVSSAPDSTFGEDVSFSATVSSQQVGTGTPTGFVQFNVDGQPLGDAVELVDGAATSETASDLEPGDHEVTVVYSGDIHFRAALESITQAVAKIETTTTLAVSDASPSFGEPVELTATVDPALDALGSPVGSVSFVDGSTTLATVPVTAAGSNATASLTVADLGAGSHAIKAVYSGSPSFAESSSAASTVTVAKVATSINAEAAVVKLLPLGLPLGQLRITLTAGGSPVDGAPVVFKVGTSTVCTSTTNSAGVATCNAASQLVQLILFNGYTASFAGDANHLPSSGKAGIIK